MRAPSPSLTLSVLQRQVMPQVIEHGMDNVVLVRPSWKQMQGEVESLPKDVTITRKPLKSQRLPVKGRRFFNNAAMEDARWPQDGLLSCRAPRLCFAVAGPIAFQAGNYVVHCNPGHSILIPPGVPHSDGSHTHLDVTRPNNGSCEMLVIMPYNGGIECWLSRTRDGKHWSHHSPGESCRILHRQAAFYFEALLEEAMSGTRHHYQMCNGLLLVLMTLLLREMEDASNVVTANLMEAHYEGSSETQTSIGRAREYIRSHLGEDLSIDRVARYVYMSRTRFTYQFRQETGQSFLEYLSDCRFEEAKVLLLDSAEWSIERVSGFVGLKPGRLRSLFHERLGLSPTDFRQQRQKG